MYQVGDKVIFEGKPAVVVHVGRKGMFYGISNGVGRYLVAYNTITSARVSIWRRIRNLF